MTARRTAIALATVALAACSEDPRYLDSPAPIVGGMVDMMGEPIPGVGTLLLPIRTERADEQADRAALATELGVDVPYVRLGDLAISVEWRLQNLDGRPGKARIKLNGGNELFFYDPSMLMAEADEEAPEPPSLAGDIPLDVPSQGAITGVLREDQLDEAAIDLEQITRANINPFRAVLAVHEELTEVQPLTPDDPNNDEDQQVPMGPPIPRRALAGLVRIDLTLESTTRMELTYSVRVRDHRGLLHDHLLAAPLEELSAFAPVLYQLP